MYLSSFQNSRSVIILVKRVGPPHGDVAQQQVVAVVLRAVVVGVRRAFGKHVGGVNAISWSFKRTGTL